MTWSLGPYSNSVRVAGFFTSVDGSLRAAANEEGSDEDGPSIQQILPRVYERLAAIMIPALLILALGFVLLYRRGDERG